MALSEATKERIKLRSTYLNNIAVGTILLGAVSSLISLVRGDIMHLARVRPTYYSGQLAWRPRQMTYDQVAFLITPALMVAGALVAAYLSAKLYPAVSIPEDNKGAGLNLADGLKRRFAKEAEESGTVIVGAASVWPDFGGSYDKPRYAAAALQSNQNIISEKLPSKKR